MVVAAHAIPLPLVYPPPSWLAHLQVLTGGSPRRLGPGEILLHEGERSSCLWVLLSGAVTLASTTPSGKRATLAVLGPGAVLGEHGLVGPLIDPRQRGPTMLPEACALTASTALAIPLSALPAAAHSDPYVGWWLVAAVSWRAVQMERALSRLLVVRVAQRVLGVLQDLALDHGRPGPGGSLIGLPLTQDLLASMVGATRESVNRAIAELEERGLVRRTGFRYELLFPPAGSAGGLWSESPDSSSIRSGLGGGAS